MVFKTHLERSVCFRVSVRLVFYIMDEKICGLRLGFQYKIYDILKWSSRPIWKGVCVLGLALDLTNIYLLNFTYDNNTVEMVSKTHLERRVFFN